MSINDISNQRSAWLSALTLMTSSGTLVCCALPALLVTLGLGASLAGIVSAAPWLIWLSTHKVWVFAIAGGLLALAAWALWRARRSPCPIDPAQALVCARLRSINAWLYGFSVLVYALGFFFAFVAPVLFF